MPLLSLSVWLILLSRSHFRYPRCILLKCQQPKVHSVWQSWWWVIKGTRVQFKPTYNFMKSCSEYSISEKIKTKDWMMVCIYTGAITSSHLIPPCLSRWIPKPCIPFPTNPTYGVDWLPSASDYFLGHSLLSCQDKANLELSCSNQTRRNGLYQLNSI